VPVVAKADTLTKAEMERLKVRLRQEISDQGIRVYQLPDCDTDEDEEYKEQVKQLKAAMPFAVCGSSQQIEVAGKKIRGRQYPWGVIDVEDPNHCDFIKLRTMLITHMQDLEDMTHDSHYENYRSERLARQATPGRGSASAAAAADATTEKDRQIQEKDAELRRMQDMLQRMQAQIAQNSTTSLQSVSSQ